METASTQVCDDILALLSRIKSLMAIAAEKHKLTPVQLGALYCIMRGQETMGQLANDMHCDASNVTGIVDRLVTQGLIKREECKTDRRAKSLQLTQKGQSLMQDMLRELPSMLGCDQLSPSEAAQLHSVAQKILG